MSVRADCTLMLSLAVTRYGQDERHDAHEHSELHLSLAIAGDLRERVGNATETAGALSVVVEGWHPAMCVRGVARQANVHPVYLARSVPRWYGISVSDALRRVRLRRAASSLATGDGTVSRTASDVCR